MLLTVRGSYNLRVSGLDLDLGQDDDVGFVEPVRAIIRGVLRMVEPDELYLVKIDSWFGDKWLGFSNKLMGAAGIQHRVTLRVPPFVPARVVSERFLRHTSKGDYIEANTTVRLHVEQASEENARRLMSVVCPKAAVFWWSGCTRANQRGALMAYLPTTEGHNGWYAEFKKVDDWRPAKTLCTTALELASYAANLGTAS